MNHQLITQNFYQIYRRFYKFEIEPINVTEKKRRLLLYCTEYPSLIQQLCDTNKIDFEDFKRRLQ
jgi:hypothetical protein